MTDKREAYKDAFAEIVQEHFSSLKRFAMSLCKDDFEADDLVSETLLKAFQNFSRINDESKIKQWLFRILNNVFISNYRRKRKIITTDFRPDDSKEDDVQSFSLFETLSKSDYIAEENPEKSYISKLTNEQIAKAVDQLPEEFKAVILLNDVEEFTYAEIAVMLKVPIGTVRSRIARGRSILQKKLWMHAKELGIRIAKTPKEKRNTPAHAGKMKKINKLF